jgi:tight adherence protein B
MTPTGIHIATFAAAALMTVSAGLLVYDWRFRYRSVLRGRIDELIAHHETSQRDAGVFKDLARLGHNGSDQPWSFRQWVEAMIEQAGVPWTVSMLAAASALGAVAAGVVGLALHGGLAVPAAGLGAFAPVGFLYARRHMRRRRLCRQLPETFQMISRAVRAGQTIPAALQIIAEDFEAPVRDEFALCYEQQNLGMSRESALRGLARRSGVMELQIFVVALLVQARSGGDLVELLDNLAAMVRKRLQLRERIRVLTGEGRLQATVLMVLPVAALATLLTTSPDYASVLVQRPWLLIGSAGMQAVGCLWIRHILNLEA